MSVMEEWTGFCHIAYDNANGQMPCTKTNTDKLVLIKIKPCFINLFHGLIEKYHSYNPFKKIIVSFFPKMIIWEPPAAQILCMWVVFNNRTIHRSVGKFQPKYRHDYTFFRGF